MLVGIYILLGPSVIICDILRTTEVGYTTTRRTVECNLIDFYLEYCPGVAVNESIEPLSLSGGQTETRQKSINELLKSDWQLRR